MKELVLLVSGMLVTWRITCMLGREHGPWSIFDKFRDLVGIEYDEYNNKIATNEIAKMVNCFWCLSVWVGCIVSACGIPPFSIMNALSLSAGAILFNMWVNCVN